MKCVAVLLLVNGLVAQDAPKMAPMAPAVAEMGNKSIIVVDPKARSSDYVQVFDLLRKDKPTLKINVRTSGAAISNVTDISATQGGTLLLLRVAGSKYQIVPVEQIEEIGYSP
jgi:hypothetical protein